MIEIDGILCEFERTGTQAGDSLADEYELIIEHSTFPDELSEDRRQRAARAVRRLNRNLATVSTILVDVGLEQYYDSVVDQLNEMNCCNGFGKLALSIKDESRYDAYSSKLIKARNKSVGL